MAHFKIDLLTPVVYDMDNTNDVSQSNHVLGNVYFLKDTLTDFYSQNIEGAIGYSYTYDEKFALHKNAQKELTFSMYRKVWQSDSWIENPFIKHLHIGSTLVLTTKEGKEHLMTVKNIALKFSAINISYQYTCQDSFSYQLIRQNDGYNLENDPASDIFIGARTVDYWVQEHIAPDCYISYEYIPLNKGIALQKSNKTIVYNSDQALNNIQEIIKTPYLDEEFYETILFSCSGSNGNAALISLAEQLGLMINVYEHLFPYQGRWTLTKYFWLEPAKHNEFNGLYYSPTNNIQSFNLSLAGDSLTTVLNVLNTDISDETIGLFPNVPGFFVNYFASPEWSNSKYSPGMFLDLLEGEYWYCDGSKADNTILGDWRTNIPFAGINYCGYQLLPQSLLLTLPRWYNKVRFYWDDNFTTFDNINGYGSKLYLYIEREVDNIINTYLIAAEEEIPQELLGQDCNIWVVYRQPATDSAPNKPTTALIYLYWYRDVTDEEYAFAEIADKCPWLENKLIDFTYFIDQKILSPNEYLLLSNFINNNIRIVNGQLMAHSQSYYSALHKQTKVLAELTSQLDMLGATCHAEIVNPYATLGKVNDASGFINAYNNFFRTFDSSRPIQLLNREELLSTYLSKFFSAEQRFLKNMKNFREYFEMANAFASRPGACIVQDKITLNNKEKSNNSLSFKPIAFTSVFQADGDKRKYKDGVVFENEPLVQLYRNKSDVYEPIIVASPSSIARNLIYTPKNLAGSLMPVGVSDEYSDNVDYFVDVKKYKELIFDYEADGIADQVEELYKDREIEYGVDNQTYIRLERSDLIKLYLSQHSGAYYIKDTERLIPLDWIRYDKSGWEKDKPINGALKGINPVVIPHEDRGTSDYWWRRETLDQPVSESFAKEDDNDTPDDKWDAWASYRFAFGLSTFYYYGPKHKLTTTYDDNNKAQYLIERINDKGWTQTEYDQEEKEFIAENPTKEFNIISPGNYNAFQPMSFYSALPNGYKQIKEFTADDYREWRSECTKNFNYFSFIPNMTMLGWGCGLIWFPFLGSGLIGGAFMEENSQWINQYPATRYFTPNEEWKHPKFKTTTDEWTAPIDYSLENKMITSLKLYDSYRAIYAKTATSMQENIDYTKAMDSNFNPITGAWDYINYYNLLVATYSFEIDNIRYFEGFKKDSETENTESETDNTKSESKITSAAYKEDDQPNGEDYRFWVKNRYYRLIGHDDFIARNETYKMLILNGKHAFITNKEENGQPAKDKDGTIITTTESEDTTTFEGPIQWNPGFDTALPTRFSAIQFGFFEAGGFININLETNDDTWRIQNDDGTIQRLILARKASEIFSKNISESNHNDFLPNWSSKDQNYQNYLWETTINGKQTYFLIIHEENYERGVIINPEATEDTEVTKATEDTEDTKVTEVTKAQYCNWDNYTVDYRNINITQIYDVETDAPAKILEQSDLFKSDSIQIFYQLKEDKNFRLATSEDWNPDSQPAYYYYSNNTYHKTYSLNNWLPQSEVLYMQNGLELLVTNFEYNTKEFDVTLYLQQRQTNNNGGFTTSYIRYPNLVHLNFLEQNTIDVSVFYNDSEYTVQATLENTVEKKPLKAMSNGEFWYRYHQQTNWPLIMEQCAIVEAELTMWWEAALTASKYCNYFLPDSWLPTIENSQNNFAQDIWQFSYKNTTDSNDISELVSVSLSPKYVPVVKLYSQKDDQGVPQTYLPAYKLTYNPTLLQTSFAAADVLQDNPAYDSCKLLLNTNGWTGWSVEETGKCTYYYIDPISNSGTKWQNIMRTLNYNSTTYDLYSGLYAMQFYILWNYYINSPLSTYEQLLEEKLGLWQYLYSLYPNVMLESSYKNEQASSSSQLYKEAMLAFKDQMQPEKQYSITIMDINRIIGDRSLFRIGEPIAINAQEYYDEPDDIFFALSQFLFITDISYNLRSDADISLTVNSIKYQEKLLQQLVKLIR